MLKKLDVLLLIILPALAVTLSLAFKTNFLTSIFLFFGLPSLWFSWRTKTKVAKTLIFSLVMTLPLGVVIDYIATLDQAWYVPTIFAFRIFSIVPVEDLIFGFFLIYYVVIFYEHFLDKGKQKLVDNHLKYLLWPLILLLVIFIGLYYVNPTLLVIPYAYFWLGLLLVLLPSLTFLYFFPRLLSKYVKTASYFFLLFLTFEFTALELNQWSFPGTNFIGWVELFDYRFPFEELFFWISMISIAILSYFEFFDDDRK